MARVAYSPVKNLKILQRSIPKDIATRISTKITPRFKNWKHSDIYYSIDPFFQTPKYCYNSVRNKDEPHFIGCKKRTLTRLWLRFGIFLVQQTWFSRNLIKNLRPHWTYFNASHRNFDSYQASFCAVIKY